MSKQEPNGDVEPHVTYLVSSVVKPKERDAFRDGESKEETFPHLPPATTVFTWR